jgi:hypothetical protein
LSLHKKDYISFLNACEIPPKADITVVDEAQKLVTELACYSQDAIERVVSANEDGRFVFLSPHAENPGKLIEDAPKNAEKAIVPEAHHSNTELNDCQSKFQQANGVTLSLAHKDDEAEIGYFKLHDRPSEREGISSVLYWISLGRKDKAR